MKYCTSNRLLDGLRDRKGWTYTQKLYNSMYVCFYVTRIFSGIDIFQRKEALGTLLSKNPQNFHLFSLTFFIESFFLPTKIFSKFRH